MDYNITPYFDDYFASGGGLDKNYYKVLFRPGRALQARELTTAQTILQNQINTFGKYFFPEGADIYGAEKAYETHSYVKLATTDSTNGAFNDFSVGDVLYDSVYKISATVVGVCPSEIRTEDIATTEPDTIWVKYISANNNISSWEAGSVLYKDTTQVAVVLDADGVVGKAEGVSVGSGIVFTKSAFVVSNSESIMVTKYGEGAYSRIGYAVKEEIIGAVSDTNISEIDVTLCDNAQGYPNFAAPGADRTKYTLFLASVDVDTTNYPLWRSGNTYARNTKVVYGSKVYICVQYHTSSSISTPGTSGTSGNGYNYWVSIDNFVEIGRIKNSIWVVSSAKIGFSQQTYDAVLDLVYQRESTTEGNYNITPHAISIDDNTEAGIFLSGGDVTVVDNDLLLVSIGSGDSVVSGKEVKNPHPERFNIEKGRTTDHVKTSTNSLIDSTYGSFILVKNPVGCFNVDGNEIVTFYSANTSVTDWSSSSNAVATANIKYFGVDPTSLTSDTPSYYRAYVYNYKTIKAGQAKAIKGMTNGAQADTEAVYEGRVGYDETGSLTSNPTTVYAKIYGSKNQSLLFPLDPSNVKSVGSTNASSTPVTYALKTFDAILKNQGGVLQLKTLDGSPFSESTMGVKFIDPANKVDTANKTYYIVNNSQYIINIHNPSGEVNVSPGVSLPFTSICGEHNSTFEVSSDGVLNLSFPTTSSNSQFAVKVQAKVGISSITNDKKIYSPGNVAYVSSAATSTTQGYDSSSINFFHADVDEIVAIYESAGGSTNSSLPTFTLSSVSGSFYKGEVIKEVVISTGVETGKKGIVLNSTGTLNQWYFVPTDGLSGSTFFTIDATTKLVGETSGGYGAVTACALNDAVRDVTGKYILRDGRKNMLYDWSAIELKQGQSAADGKLAIVYNRYKLSSGRNGVFTLNSYGTFVNNDFVSYYETGSVHVDYNKLPASAQQLDFRPVRIDLNFTSDLSQGYISYITNYVDFLFSGENVVNISPYTEDPVKIDYSYFVGRTDYAIINKEGQFQIVTGVPGGSEPQQPEGSMLLWKINVPPYTAKPSDVQTVYVENKLYKQKDIAKLEERIKSLEQFAKVTDDEIKAVSKSEPSLSSLYFGLERFKNGILLDTFTGFDKSDLQDFGFRCAIDSINQTLRPPFSSTSIDMDAVTDLNNATYNSKFSTSTDNLRGSSGALTISYTSTSFISQPKISSAVYVNPYNVFSFMGRVSLSPASDTWYDVTVLPDIVVQAPENQTYINLENSVNEKLLIKINVGEAAYFAEGDNVWTSKGGTAIVSSVDRVSGTLTLFHHNGNFGAELDNYLRSSKVPGAGVHIQAMSTSGGAAGYGTIFGDWNFHWTGWNIDVSRAISEGYTGGLNIRTTPNLLGRDTRTGVRQDLVLKTVNTVTDVKYIDTGIIPYIRTKEVYFTASGLKPNTTMYPFFDSKGVSSYCYQRNNSAEPWTFNSSTGLTTDKYGNVQGKFVLPGGTFRTGEKKFRIVDVNLDTFTAASPDVSSIADATYTATGIKQTKQSTVLSTKVPEVVSASLTNERVTSVQWIDPLAQTFLVKDQEYSAGMYLTSLELYFSNKATSSSLPVWVELRSVENGYPTNVTIPGTQVFKTPDEVTLATSSNGYTTTAFTFDNPIYLAPGEYAFVVLSNSNEYQIYTGEMGRVDIRTNELICAQPYTGSMFKSQNGSTWTAIQEADIAFNLNRAVFSTSASVVFNQNNELMKALDLVGYDATSGVFNFDICYTLMNFGTSTIVPSGTTLKWEYQTSTKTSGSLRSETSWTEFVPYTDVEFTAPRYIRGNIGSVKFKATMTSSSDAVSPLIDLTDQRCILVENMINAPETNPSLDPALGEYVPNGGAALAKHISKSVVLEDGMDAEDIKVYIKGSRRKDETSVSNIQAFVKFISQKDSYTPFEDRFWYPLVMSTDPGYSSSKSDYKNYVFELPKNIWIVKRMDTEIMDIYYTGDGRVITVGGAPATYTYDIADMDMVLGVNDYIYEHVSYDKEAERLTYTYYNNLYTNGAALDPSDGDTIARGSFTNYIQYATKVVMTSSNVALTPIINEVKTLALT